MGFSYALFFYPLSVAGVARGGSRGWARTEGGALGKGVGVAIRAARPCRYPGCPAVTRGVPYCDEHARRVSREYERDRPSSAARGYGSTWRKVRARQLSRAPLCADPDGLHDRPVVATEADHIIRRARGGSDADNNLQSLCKSCHSRKTAREVGFAKVGS